MLCFLRGVLCSFLAKPLLLERRILQAVLANLSAVCSFCTEPVVNSVFFVVVGTLII